MHVTNYVLSKGFPCGAMVKNPPAKAGDLRDEGSIQGLGRSPGEGNANQLQYSCLGSHRGACWATEPMGWQRAGQRCATKQQQMC